MDKNNDGQGLITGIQLSILNDVNWMIEWTRIKFRRDVDSADVAMWPMWYFVGPYCSCLKSCRPVQLKPNIWPIARVPVWVKSGYAGVAGVRGLEFWTTNWNPLPNPNDRIVLTGA